MSFEIKEILGLFKEMIAAGAVDFLIKRNIFPKRCYLKCSKSSNIEIRWLLANHKDTPIRILEALASDNSFLIREAVFRNILTNINKSNRDLLLILATEFKTTINIEKIMKDWDKDTKKFIFKNIHLFL